MNTVEWANSTADDIPRIADDAPGPRSLDLHARMERHATKSYGQNVALFPVVFAVARGVVLTDLDGNHYLDFTSGAVVTNIGHADPKVIEAIARGGERARQRQRFRERVARQRSRETCVGDTGGNDAARSVFVDARCPSRC